MAQAVLEACAGSGGGGSSDGGIFGEGGGRDYGDDDCSSCGAVGNFPMPGLHASSYLLTSSSGQPCVSSVDCTSHIEYLKSYVSDYNVWPSLQSV